jgi:hypothetical protein
MIAAISGMWSVARGRTSGGVIRSAAKSVSKRSSHGSVSSAMEIPAAFAFAMIRSSTSVMFMTQVTRRPR